MRPALQMSASTPRSIAPRGIATHQSRVISFVFYPTTVHYTLYLPGKYNPASKKRPGFQLYKAIVKRKSRERLRRTTLAVVSQLPSLWEFFYRSRRLDSASQNISVYKDSGYSYSTREMISRQIAGLSVGNEARWWLRDRGLRCKRTGANESCAGPYEQRIFKQVWQERTKD